jgi:Tol biopolymer transport system component
MKNRNHAAITIIFTTIWSLSCATLFPNTARETSIPTLTENATFSTIVPEVTTPANSKLKGKIVYTKGGYIYTINADGTNDTRLIIGSSPIWSSDGNTIAYFSEPDADLKYDIYLMNADGTNQRPLLPAHPEYDLPKEISWQPNGNLIVLSAYSETDKTEIFSVDVKTGEALQITRNHPDDWAPVWHPDGKQILYLSPVLNKETQNYDDKVHIMNADGANPRQFFTPDGRDIHPVFSPNGGLIAFRHTLFDDNSNFTGWGLYVINSDGSSEKLIFQSPRIFFLEKWSPDGQSILFTAKSEENIYQLFIINADGTNLTFLTDGYGGDWYSSDTGSTTSLPPAQEINQNANCETGVVITSSETPKGQQLDICAFGDKYQIAALAKGSYAVGPNNKFFVYATNGGEVYAVRIGQTNFQKIGSIKDFFRIRNGEIPKLEFTFEEDQSYKVTIRETESNEKQTFAIPNYISAP